MVSAKTAVDESPKPHYVTAPRHRSLYNQNFDELQSISECKVEKLLFRMSFDEILNNTISTDRGQITQNLPSSSLPVSHFPDNSDLNATTGRKILDQLWSGFVAQEHVNRTDKLVHPSSLEEAAVEYLMLRAGAMNVLGKMEHIGADALPLTPIDPMEIAPQQAKWKPLQMQLQIPVGLTAQIRVFVNQFRKYLTQRRSAASDSIADNMFVEITSSSRCSRKEETLLR